MATVKLRNIGKQYETYEAVRGFDLDIKDEEFIVLVGPSGCGKSTTLRMVAGLEEITSGDLVIGEQRVNQLSPSERDIAMVFQNYALYPHMTVAENMAFGLKQKRLPKAEIDKRIAEAARVLELEKLLDRKPRALSGGQRQRVAMGRAIVRNPKVFLFDEPLSNLDAKLRVQMRAEIKRLHQTIPTTTIYVTHDQVEAMTMADRVVVMNKGRIEQVGPPQELYNNPATLFVAEFIGSPGMNILPVKVAKNDAGQLVAELADGQLLVLPEARRAAYEQAAGRDMLLGLRPEAFRAAGEGLSATVDYIEPLGAETLAFLSLGGRKVCAKMDAMFRAGKDEAIRLQPDLERMHLIDPVSEKVLAV